MKNLTNKEGKTIAIISYITIIGTVIAFVMNNEGLKTGLVVKTDEELGIAFAKDTPELLEAVNEALAEIIDDGTYDEIFAKWFGKG